MPERGRKDDSDNQSHMADLTHTLAQALDLRRQLLASRNLSIASDGDADSPRDMSRSHSRSTSPSPSPIMPRSLSKSTAPVISRPATQAGKSSGVGSVMRQESGSGVDLHNCSLTAMDGFAEIEAVASRFEDSIGRTIVGVEKRVQEFERRIESVSLSLKLVQSIHKKDLALWTSVAVDQEEAIVQLQNQLIESNKREAILHQQIQSLQDTVATLQESYYAIIDASISFDGHRDS
eukprot:TRINITY_DN13619_c0_g1_i1.p1 TRINITY_DN13619_c0_g1~~TRINITY_DN13619_c0_g1_i1.p1  ORF type:complete len:235 (-),score=59.04 TRINITY_DN13619_c0_g1_i1:51-755(-)